jgi:hypothetical protein
MTKVIAIMSMSLDGYVADANDGVAEVFDWYFAGDVEVPTASTTSGVTFHVSAQSADHLRGLQAEVGAMLTGRRTFERADGWPRPGSTVQFVTDGIESAVARAKSAAAPKSVGVHGAQTIQQSRICVSRAHVVDLLGTTCLGTQRASAAQGTFLNAGPAERLSAAADVGVPPHRMDEPIESSQLRLAGP